MSFSIFATKRTPSILYGLYSSGGPPQIRGKRCSCAECSQFILDHLVPHTSVITWRCRFPWSQASLVPRFALKVVDIHRNSASSTTFAPPPAGQQPILRVPVLNNRIKYPRFRRMRPDVHIFLAFVSLSNLTLLKRHHPLTSQGRQRVKGLQEDAYIARSIIV